VPQDALKALREVAVRHAGNTAVLIAAGDAAAAHVGALLSELKNGQTNPNRGQSN
jgi:hypothetical protein